MKSPVHSASQSRKSVSSIAIGIWDAFPVSAGHALLVPVRHIATWFDASSEERMALTQAIDFAREAIEANHRPDGYNIGINSGDAAGQTVFHLHVHIIPRYRGDVPDPRGGVRHVIPSRGNYLSGPTSDHSNASISERVLITGAEDPLLPLLKPISLSRTRLILLSHSQCAVA